MFCPKCATQNIDGAHFCRSCGANISLVPQALSGQLPQAQAPPEDVDSYAPRYKRGKELTIDNSLKNIFLGVGFLIVAIALSRSIGEGWWFWMLIPAFAMMGRGVGQFIRLREAQKRAALAPPPVNRSFVEPPRPAEQLRNPVGSVTEGTTRHLGVEAPTRHLDHEHK
jgi:hypothetical protein